MNLLKVNKMKNWILMISLIFNFNYFGMAQIPNGMCVPQFNYIDNLAFNLDSAFVIDTCSIWHPSLNPDSVFWNNINSTYGDTAMSRVYAKKYWDVKFDVPAILLDSVRGDSLLFVTQNAIDSINYPNLKYGFNQLEIKYGTYRLRKVAPHLITGKGSQYFNLYFDNYAPMGEVWYTLDTMEHVYCEFKGWPPITQNDVSDLTSKNDLIISPNPASEYIEITAINQRVNPWVDGQTYIRIVNVYGRQMYNFVGAHCNVPLRIDISSFPDGVYFLKLSGSSELSESYQTQKFVVIK
jgi:hypothetical protein